MIADLSGGLGRTSHVSSHSTGTLQIAHFTFFAVLLALLLSSQKLIFVAIKTCSSFSKHASSGGV